MHSLNMWYSCMSEGETRGNAFQWFFFSSFCLYRIHGVSSVAMRSPPLFHTPQWMRMQARTLTAEIRWFVISDISTSHLPVPFTRQNILKTSKPNDSKNKRRKKEEKHIYAFIIKVWIGEKPSTERKKQIHIQNKENSWKEEVRIHLFAYLIVQCEDTHTHTCVVEARAKTDIWNDNNILKRRSKNLCKKNIYFKDEWSPWNAQSCRCVCCLPIVAAWVCCGFGCNSYRVKTEKNWVIRKCTRVSATTAQANSKDGN